MLALVAIGSVLALVYLLFEFVWWSPTTNDRRRTAALGLRKRYKKSHASGAKQLHAGTPPLDAAKPINPAGIAIIAVALKDDIQIPSFDVPPPRVNRGDAHGMPSEQQLS